MGRRNRSIAKIEIYGAFRDAIQLGATKASVSAIVEATGMNRNTFYNHFSCRDELVAWGFRFDLMQVLLASHDVEELESPVNDPYNFENLPCYYRVPSGTLSLNQSGFLDEMYQVFYLHKDYYRTLLGGQFAEPFYRYLVELLQGLFIGDVEYFLSGRKMPDEAKQYIATFFAEGTVHHMVDAVFGNMIAKDAVDDIPPVNNLVHEAMYHMVEAYQNERSSAYFNRRQLL